MVFQQKICLKLQKESLRDSMDVRDCFFDKVYSIARKNKNVLFLTSDHTAFSLKKFEKELPDQYLNLGISEQNIMGVAAGLSMRGKIVFVYGIAPFMSLRCLEQIAIDICSMNNNVNIISMGSGLTYSSDGPTHHGTMETSILATIPKIQIYNVSDITTASYLPSISIKNKGPKFFRIEKGTLKKLYNKPKSLIQDGLGFEKNSKQNLIITTGITTQIAYSLKERLNDKKFSILDIIRFKPLNKKKVQNIVKKYNNIICLEENVPHGGVASLISSIIAENSLKKKFIKKTLPDKFLFDSGPREWMQNKYGLEKIKILKDMNKIFKNE